MAENSISLLLVKSKTEILDFATVLSENLVYQYQCCILVMFKGGNCKDLLNKVVHLMVG